LARFAKPPLTDPKRRLAVFNEPPLTDENGPEILFAAPATSPPTEL
jgi:hypothetical protein